MSRYIALNFPVSTSLLFSATDFISFLCSGLLSAMMENTVQQTMQRLPVKD